MENVLVYITNHYIYFLIAAVFLIISTMGYVIEDKKTKMEAAKEAKQEEVKPAEAKK